MKGRKRRLLYIAPNVVLDLPGALSAHFSGDYVAIWPFARLPGAAEDKRKIEASFGDFRFHYTPDYRLPVPLKQLWDVAFFVRTGLRLMREGGKHDAILVYAPYRTGLAAYLLRCLTGVKLIIEYPQDPQATFRFDRSFVGRIKHRLSPAVARWMAKQADRIVVLYPRQLQDLALPPDVRHSLVHPFVRTKAVPRGIPGEKVILLLGSPLLLKGADVLIRAFRLVSPRFPDYRLVIAGPDTDTAALRELAGPDLPVDFLGRLDHAAALRLLASCAVFILPSRTEGLPRVIIEAMAAGRPVIASTVGGIPYLVRDGETGLLFRSEDHEDLAEKLSAVLTDPALAARLGACAEQFVGANFTEERVAEMWAEAVRETLA